MISTEETERIKNLIRIIGENIIEPMARNLEAHKTVFEMFRPVNPDLDAYLAAARKDPALLESVRQQYHEPLERLLRSIPAVLSETEGGPSAQWLQSKKPEDPTN